jgi:hypothetical protein
MYVDLSAGEYQFRNDCHADIPQRLHQIALDYHSQSANNSDSIVAILSELFNIESNSSGSSPIWQSWLSQVSSYYFLIFENEQAGKNQIETLQHVLDATHWIKLNEVEETVTGIVNRTPAIDVHTHLFSQSHGGLLLCGIDELLTYHYLVAEYFMTAPLHVKPAGIEIDMLTFFFCTSPVIMTKKCCQDFYQLTKREQADQIWAALFVARSPISEACQGVVTTLKEFGLASLVERRDLEAIRKWASQFSLNEYVEKVNRQNMKNAKLYFTRKIKPWQK